MRKINLLKNRKIITIEGEDRFKFLQGIITNDIEKINNNLAIYSCLLTPQGKYLADFFISELDGCLIIDLPDLSKDYVIKKFTLYKLRSKIEIADRSNEYLIYSILDKNFSFHTQGSIVKLEHALAFVDPRLKNLGVRAFVSIHDKSKIEKTYPDHSDYYDRLRIDHLVPEGHKDMIAEKSFPLEFGLEKFNAIDFKKGCYVGQELISRTHYRGVVRKRIFKITSNTNMAKPGSEITANGQKIGIVCSTIENTGLAMLRTEDWQKAVDDKLEFYAGDILIEISSS